MNKSGYREEVRKLIREYRDIFTNNEKKVGMVPDRYCTTIKLKLGTVPTEAETKAPPAASQTEGAA